MAIHTVGIRHGDEPRFWQKSPVLRNANAAHFPYIVMWEAGPGIDTVNVTTVRNVVDLLQYPDDAMVLWQWQGAERSDFFRFTVGDFRREWEAVRNELRADGTEA